MFDEIEKAEAVAACREAGHDPYEVIPVGTPTRLQGDLLTDGPEAERWMLEMPTERLRKLGLA